MQRRLVCNLRGITESRITFTFRVAGMAATMVEASVRRPRTYRIVRTMRRNRNGRLATYCATVDSEDSVSKQLRRRHETPIPLDLLISFRQFQLRLGRTYAVIAALRHSDGPAPSRRTPRVLNPFLEIPSGWSRAQARLPRDSTGSLPTFCTLGTCLHVLSTLHALTSQCCQGHIRRQALDSVAMVQVY